MRTELAHWAGRRRAYRATFARLGTVPGTAGQVVYKALVVDVKDMEAGHRVADHVWLPVTATWPPLQPGDRLAFSGIPWRYERGYRGRAERLRALLPPSTDYHLIALREVRRIGRAPLRQEVAS